MILSTFWWNDSSSYCYFFNLTTHLNSLLGSSHHVCATPFSSPLPIHVGLHSHSVHGLTERENGLRGGERRQTERAFPGNMLRSKYVYTIKIKTDR